ncbi:MAG: hypothetical protein ABIE74_06185 [Pseudomonadota bacterium]
MKNKIRALLVLLSIFASMSLIEIAHAQVEAVSFIFENPEVRWVREELCFSWNGDIVRENDPNIETIFGIGYKVLNAYGEQILVGEARERELCFPLFEQNPRTAQSGRFVLTVDFIGVHREKGENVVVAKVEKVFNVDISPPPPSEIVELRANPFELICTKVIDENSGFWKPIINLSTVSKRSFFSQAQLSFIEEPFKWELTEDGRFLKLKLTGEDFQKLLNEASITELDSRIYLNVAAMDFAKNPSQTVAIEVKEDVLMALGVITPPAPAPVAVVQTTPAPTLSPAPAPKPVVPTQTTTYTPPPAVTQVTKPPVVVQPTQAPTPPPAPVPTQTTTYTPPPAVPIVTPVPAPTNVVQPSPAPSVPLVVQQPAPSAPVGVATQTPATQNTVVESGTGEETSSSGKVGMSVQVPTAPIEVTPVNPEDGKVSTAVPSSNLNLVQTAPTATSTVEVKPPTMQVEPKSAPIPEPIIVEAPLAANIFTPDIPDSMLAKNIIDVPPPTMEEIAPSIGTINPPTGVIAKPAPLEEPPSQMSVVSVPPPKTPVTVVEKPAEEAGTFSTGMETPVVPAPAPEVGKMTAATSVAEPEPVVSEVATFSQATLEPVVPEKTLEVSEVTTETSVEEPAPVVSEAVTFSQATPEPVIPEKTLEVSEVTTETSVEEPAPVVSEMAIFSQTTPEPVVAEPAPEVGKITTATSVAEPAPVVSQMITEQTATSNVPATIHVVTAETKIVQVEPEVKIEEGKEDLGSFEQGIETPKFEEQKVEEKPEETKSFTQGMPLPTTPLPPSEPEKLTHTEVPPSQETIAKAGELTPPSDMTVDEQAPEGGISEFLGMGGGGKCSLTPNGEATNSMELIFLAFGMLIIIAAKFKPVEVIIRKLSVRKLRRK